MLDIDALRQVPLFAKLAEPQLQWLSEQGKEVWLEPGELHRAEGDLADHVYVMLEGEVRVFQKVGDRELVLATYGSKTLFGELPVLMGQEYLWASGRAVTRCHIFELPIIGILALAFNLFLRYNHHPQHDGTADARSSNVVTAARKTCCTWHLGSWTGSRDE